MNKTIIYSRVRKSIYVLLLAALSLSFVGCEQKGPAERAGENIDEAVEELRDSGKDLGNKIEDACEDIKEGMGAKDEDC